MPNTRNAYLQAADTATDLLSDDRVASAWVRPSALGDMTVGALAGHLARSVLQVEWFLDGAVDGAPNVSSVTYYARIADAPDPGSDLNRGVRARSEETARLGPETVALNAWEALTRLRRRLPRKATDRTALHALARRERDETEALRVL